MFDTALGIGRTVALSSGRVAYAQRPYFPARLFEQSAAALPDARLVSVADSYTFVLEDQPSEFTRLVFEFLE